MRLSSVIVLFTLLLPTAAFGQSAFIDPALPDQEVLLYTAVRDKETYRMTQRTVRKIENGRPVYEVTTESLREDFRLKIDIGKMSVYYSWTRRTRPELQTETEMKIVKNEIADKPGEATILDFTGLFFILRGFPFESTRSLKLKTAAGGVFSFTVTRTKETDIKTAAGVIRCYELELGMDGFFGAFVPKTYFWFEKAAPHRLVRYQGQTAGPGSPSYLIELEGAGTN